MRYQSDDKHDRSAYFLSRTIKQPCPFLTTPCLLWQGATSNGRPVARVLGRLIQVHRYVFSTFCGGAPGYLKATCAQPLCINPAHQAP